MRVRRRQRLQREREHLPVHLVRERLLAELRTAQTAVLVGETGSGKTTQVPRLLLESGLAHGGIIACTQPRRVAAITIAQRVAAEMGAVVGGLVRSRGVAGRLARSLYRAGCIGPIPAAHEVKQSVAYNTSSFAGGVHSAI